MRRMVDEPAERAAIDAGLQDVYTALGVGPASMTTKAALNLLGHRVGIPRLPLVEADAAETATIRAMLEARGLLEPAGA
jgi:4-hydroxy-tetrahydrodipicolinate synthase